MKRLFQVASALLLSALLTAPAFAADFGFKSDMKCIAGGNGTTKISPNGTLHINMNNLAPSTAFDCEVVCFILGVGFGPVSPCATTDSAGKFQAEFPGAVGACIGPIVAVGNFGNLCINGVVP
jgi:hypothetical protein